MNLEQAQAAGKPILLFDGVCNFCNTWVNLLLRIDRSGIFCLTPLQSPAGSRLLEMAGRDPAELKSIVLVADGQVFDRSTAVIEICRRLGGVFKLALPLQFVPDPIRDGLYNFVARHRYRFFGVREACMIPDQGFRDRFLSDV